MNAASETDVELGVPLVEATPVARNPVMTESSPPTIIRVNVTAPATLPPGYVLQILYQEKDESGNATGIWKKGFVQVPADGEGVQKGEVFEAATQPCDTVKQIRGHWHVSEFDWNVCCCSPTTDADFCLLSWCCAPIAWACIYEQLMDLDKQNLGKKVYRPRFAVKSMGALSLLFLILSLVSIVSRTATTESKGGDSGITTVFGIAFLIFGVAARSKIREYYSIKGGNYFLDCLWNTCFSTCSVLQSYHQMKKAHEHPHLGYLPNEPLPAEAEKLV